MRRSISVLIALVVMAAMLAAFAAPAFATHRGFFDDDEDCFVFAGLLFCNDDLNVLTNRDRFTFEDGISQEIEQDAESGDVDQDFVVGGGGDNSNQTVGIEGTANTGNTQNAIGIIDAGD